MPFYKVMGVDKDTAIKAVDDAVAGRFEHIKALGIRVKVIDGLCAVSFHGSTRVVSADPCVLRSFLNSFLGIKT
jgi:hypothetical protein